MLDNDVNALIAEASLAQRPYVADGKVTPAERESAFLAFLACMEKEGLVTTDYSLRTDGGESVTQATGALTAEQVDRITSTCRTYNYTIVGAVYAAHNQRSEEEEREVLDKAAGCMRDRGIDVPDKATLNQLSEADRGTATECYAAAERH